MHFMMPATNCYSHLVVDSILVNFAFVKSGGGMREYLCERNKLCSNENICAMPAYDE